MEVLEGRQVEARYYNQVVRGCQRLGPELRLVTPALKHLGIILQRDAWIVVDRAMNEMPVLAWVDFETEGRSSLHEPIPCRIKLWHFMACMIMPRALQALTDHLDEELAVEEGAHGGERVLPFRPREADHRG